MVNTNQVNLTGFSVGSKKKVICYQLQFGKILLIFRLNAPVFSYRQTDQMLCAEISLFNF